MNQILNAPRICQAKAGNCSMPVEFLSMYDNQGRIFDIKVLYDCGASISLIDEKLAISMGAMKEYLERDISVYTLHGKSEITHQYIVPVLQQTKYKIEFLEPK